MRQNGIIDWYESQHIAAFNLRLKLTLSYIGATGLDPFLLFQNQNKQIQVKLTSQIEGEIGTSSGSYKTFFGRNLVFPNTKKFVLMSESAQKWYFKQNYTLKLFIAFKTAYSWCISLRRNLDFIQKSFTTSTTQVLIWNKNSHHLTVNWR